MGTSSISIKFNMILSYNNIFAVLYGTYSHTTYVHIYVHSSYGRRKRSYTLMYKFFYALVYVCVFIVVTVLRIIVAQREMNLRKSFYF